MQKIFFYYGHHLYIMWATTLQPALFHFSQTLHTGTNLIQEFALHAVREHKPHRMISSGLHDCPILESLMCNKNR